MLDISYLMDFTSCETARLNLVITAGQLKAARALLGVEQKTLAELAGVSLPTIQRMEASDGTVRGNVETLTKVVEALDRAGIELLYVGGRGVRLRERDSDG
jgi:transcriptional regulator with XRE-family HTH domain